MFQQRFIAMPCIEKCGDYKNLPVNLNSIICLDKEESKQKSGFYYIIRFYHEINEKYTTTVHWYYFSEKNRDADYNKIMKRFSF